MPSQLKFLEDKKNPILGREIEFNRLKEFVLDQNDINKLVLLYGSAGSGKTEWLNQLSDELSGTELIWIKSKNNSADKKFENCALIDCLNQLMNEWIKDFQLSQLLKNFMLDQYGTVIPYLADLLPEIRSLLGLDKNEKNYNFIEFDENFTEIIIKLLQELSRYSQPVIFEIDDAENIDIGSINFIKNCLNNPQISNINWILSFRMDESVSLNNLLKHFKKSASNQFFLQSEIKLIGLSTKEIEKHCIERYPIDKASQSILSEILFQFTAGNPFFVIEAIRYFIEIELLIYQSKEAKYHYNPSVLKKLSACNDIFAFLHKKIESIHNRDAEVLCTAAVIGTEFSTFTIQQITEIPHNQIQKTIAYFINKGVFENQDINSSENKFLRFSHKIYQQAAYNFYNDDKKQLAHYRLGQTYLSVLGNAAVNKNIYEIVYQFNNSYNYAGKGITNEKLAKLNIAAGKKALGNMAYNSASIYFNRAIDTVTIDQSSWLDVDLYNLYLLAGSTSRLKYDLIQAVTQLELALKYAGTAIEKAVVYREFIKVFNIISDVQSSWDSSVIALKTLNVNFSNKISKPLLIAKLIQINYLLKTKNFKKLLNEGLSKNEKIVLGEEIIILLGNTCYIRNEKVIAYNYLKSMELTLLNGLSANSIFGMIGYGKILAFGLRKIQRSEKYFNRAFQMLDYTDNPSLKTEAQFRFYTVYNLLFGKIKDSIHPLEKNYYHAQISGNYHLAMHSTLVISELHLIIGTKLKTLSTLLNNYIYFLRRTNNSVFYENLTELRAIVEQLTSKENKAKKAKIISIDESNSIRPVVFTNSIYQIQYAVLIRDINTLPSLIYNLENKGSETFRPIEINQLAYCAIGAHELFENNYPKKSTVKRLSRLNRKVKPFLKNDNSNYQHLKWLISGLLADCENEKQIACKHLHQAIEIVSKENFIPLIASYNEKLARLYFKYNHIDDGKFHLIEAIKYFNEWGAINKVNQLQTEFLL